jgi:rod shape-determining protein MreC
MALSTPDSEPKLFSGGSGGLRSLLLIAAAIVLMVLDHRNEHLLEIRATLGKGLYPLQEAVSAPFAAGRWVRENLATRATLVADNARLKSENLEQAGRLQRLAALEAENARMRALLQSTAKVGDQLVIAEIVAVDMDRLRHRVVVNRGSQNGAQSGQAMIDAQGVVGQLIRDRGDSSEALLITDPDHAVPVELVRNGLRTITVGTGDMERLALPFIARNADVQPGDLLVSSGLGGKFPAGYPVATVVEVRGDTGEPFLTVRAKPTASLDRVREVLLVRSQESAAPAAPEPQAAEPAPAAIAAPSASSRPAPSATRPATPPAETSPAAAPPTGADTAAPQTPAPTDPAPADAAAAAAPAAATSPPTTLPTETGPTPPPAATESTE